MTHVSPGPLDPLVPWTPWTPLTSCVRPVCYHGWGRAVAHRPLNSQTLGAAHARCGVGSGFVARRSARGGAIGRPVISAVCRAVPYSSARASVVRAGCRGPGGAYGRIVCGAGGEFYFFRASFSFCLMSVRKYGIPMGYRTCEKRCRPHTKLKTSASRGLAASRLKSTAASTVN